jgi:hypothetical protein
MNIPKIVLPAALVIIIGCLVAYGILREKSKALPVVEHQSVVSNTHPYVELQPGERIVWENNDTSFTIYNENSLKSNERIITISQITKVAGGYALKVQDHMYVSYGGVMDDGSIEETNGGYGEVSLRGSQELVLPNATNGSYIGISADEPLGDVSLTATSFANHFTKKECFTDQYSCLDFRNLYWFVTVDGDTIVSFKQAYQE